MTLTTVKQVMLTLFRNYVSCKDQQSVTGNFHC
jgi:hypothetical protein